MKVKMSRGFLVLMVGMGLLFLSAGILCAENEIVKLWECEKAYHGIQSKDPLSFIGMKLALKGENRVEMDSIDIENGKILDSEKILMDDLKGVGKILPYIPDPDKKSMEGIIIFQTKSKGKQIRAVKDGQELYTVELDLSVRSSFLSIPDKVLVLFDKNGRYCGINFFTGEKLWSKEPAGKWSIVDFLDYSKDGEIVVVDKRSGKVKLIVINVNNGDVLAEINTSLDFENFNGPVFYGPFLNEGLTYIVSKGISCIDFQKKQELWHKPFSVVSGKGASAALTIMAGTSVNTMKTVKVNPVFTKNGGIVFYDVKGNIYCLDKKTGKEKWEKEAEGFINDQITVDDQMIFYIGKRLFTSVNAESGKTLWTYKNKKNVNDMIAVGTTGFIIDKKMFTKLNLADGKILSQKKSKKAWKFKKPLFLAKGRYDNELLMGNKNQLLLLDLRTEKPIWVSKLKSKAVDYEVLDTGNSDVLLVSANSLDAAYISALDYKKGSLLYGFPNGSLMLASAWRPLLFSDKNIMIRGHLSGLGLRGYKVLAQKIDPRK